MSDESKLLYFRMNMLQAEIEMNAMKAENKQRELLGESPAYTERDFMNLIEKHGIGENAFLVEVKGLRNQEAIKEKLKASEHE
jgi:hypothetical protein